MTTLLVALFLVPRPVLSGPEDKLFTDDGVFVVHSTNSGVDSVLHPEDPAAVKAGLEAVFARWVKGAGMGAPYGDGGIGGDARIDVYLRKLDGARGNTYPEDVGAAHGASAWIELDPRSSLKSEMRLSAAAGHEAHHAIQYGYSTTLDRWIYEATAAYAENAGFAGMQDETNAHYLDILSHPETPLDTVDGTHEYDEMVFVRFLATDKDDRTKVNDAVIAALWAEMLKAGDVVSGIEALRLRTMPWRLHDFTDWLLSACPTSGPSGFASCTADDQPRLVGIVAAPSVIDVPLPPLGMGFVKMPRLGACELLSVRLDGTDDVAWFDLPGDVGEAGDGGVGHASPLQDQPFIVARGAAKQSHGQEMSLTISATSHPDDSRDCRPIYPGGCGNCAVGAPRADRPRGARQRCISYVAEISFVMLFLIAIRRRKRSRLSDGKGFPSGATVDNLL